MVGKKLYLTFLESEHLKSCNVPTAYQLNCRSESWNYSYPLRRGQELGEISSVKRSLIKYWTSGQNNHLQLKYISKRSVEIVHIRRTRLHDDLWLELYEMYTAIYPEIWFRKIPCIPRPRERERSSFSLEYTQANICWTRYKTNRKNTIFL